MKKLILILAFVLPMSLITFGQIEDQDGQLFGSKRPTNEYNYYNFELITLDVVEHEFIIQNPNIVKMNLISFNAAPGISVEFISKVIEPGSLGKFVVKVDKNVYNKKGEFSEIITIITETENAVSKVKKEFSYTIEGTF